MKNFTLLSLLCLFLISTIPVESFSQNTASFNGQYTIPNTESLLKIQEVPGSNKITASITGIKIHDRGSIKKPIILKGKYKLVKQRSEEFYLITLQGMGKWVDSKGKKYPIAFTLSGFITKHNPKSMTSQFAAAYEFKGNAEDIIGGILGWRKKS